MSGVEQRDHGGGLDAALARYGGRREDWLDLSTGINPDPYPLPDFSPSAWNALPDTAAEKRLLSAARSFWKVPDSAEIIAAPGASALIAQMPALAAGDQVFIPAPTYNEHAAAFRAHGFAINGDDASLATQVHVHPNNPDGRFFWPDELDHPNGLTIIDESFCDVDPARSHIVKTAQPGTIILKSFGKFWGLAGMRLGFAIAHPDTLAPKNRPSLKDLIGPWAVSGPALAAGAAALEDRKWASRTRALLAERANALDTLMTQHGARLVGGTSLFRLYETGDAEAAKHALCEQHILTRSFPYSKTWLRVGIPPAERWDHLIQAIKTAAPTLSTSKSVSPAP
ncbi:MAG: threonine-phosphate decarboxylase [Pseudomonadota bacterium]